MRKIAVWGFLALSSLGFGVGCVLLPIAPRIALTCGIFVLVCSAFLGIGAIIIEDAISFIAAFILAATIASCILFVDILDLDDHVIRYFISIWLAPIQVLIAALCLQSMERLNLEWSHRATGVINLLVATSVVAVMFTLLGRTNLIDASPFGWVNCMILTLQSVLLVNRLIPFLIDRCSVRLGREPGC
jgi:hypothetical protein